MTPEVVPNCCPTLGFSGEPSRRLQPVLAALQVRQPESSVPLLQGPGEDLSSAEKISLWAIEEYLATERAFHTTVIGVEDDERQKNFNLRTHSPYSPLPDRYLKLA